MFRIYKTRRRLTKEGVLEAFWTAYTGELALAATVSVVIAVIAGFPLAIVWAVNTLFGLTIPTTFKTWAAALVLMALFYNSSGSKR